MASTRTPQPREAYNRRRRGSRAKTPRPVGLILAIAIPLDTYVLTTAAATLLDHQAPATYFQTVAFLIPSLLVTLAVQGQFFRIGAAAPPPERLAERHPRAARAWTRGQRVAAVAMLGYLASGELASLYVLAARHSTPLLFGVTAGAVVTAFIAVAVIALIGTPWKR